MTNKTKNKPSKFKPAARFSFSRKNAFLIVAAFVIIGGLFIYKSFAATVSTKPIVAIAADDSNGGYWYAGLDGGVFSYGDAHFVGSAAGKFGLTASNYAVGISALKTTKGYYVATSTGRVFAFNAPFHGDIVSRGIALTQPIVGIVATSSGDGYWLVSKDGRVYAFGGAQFYGGLLGLGINVTNIVGMARVGGDDGYYLAGSDGGVYAFGNAPFKGSIPSIKARLTKPISGIVRGSGGYYLVAQDGGVFAFGAPFYGSAVGKSNYPVTGIDITTGGGGYYLVAQDGGIFAYGNAKYLGNTAPSFTPTACQSLNANQRGNWPDCRAASCALDGVGKTVGSWPNCSYPLQTCWNNARIPVNQTCPARPGGGTPGSSGGGSPPASNATASQLCARLGTDDWATRQMERALQDHTSSLTPKGIYAAKETVAWQVNTDTAINDVNSVMASNCSGTTVLTRASFDWAEGRLRFAASQLNAWNQYLSAWVSSLTNKAH
ncbi:MAG: Esterase [Candidatus Saccharibacteria bacterium]|nr:Esterase [Candidatus Saccharibacteria bacterium]